MGVFIFAKFHSTQRTLRMINVRQWFLGLIFDKANDEMTNCRPDTINTCKEKQ